MLYIPIPIPNGLKKVFVSPRPQETEKSSGI